LAEQPELTWAAIGEEARRRAAREPKREPQRLDAARGQEVLREELAGTRVEGALADPRLAGRGGSLRVGVIVADVIASGAAARLIRNKREERALLSLARCQTEALGGVEERCSDCEWWGEVWKSCGTRLCPQCQSLKSADWLEKELERALPVNYFHGVLTLPPALRPAAERGDRAAERVYRLLFWAARSALDETAWEELGERGPLLGLTLILHTWNSRLESHAHVHAIVTGGALSRCGTHWLEAKAGRSLFPLDVLRERYRAALLTEVAREERADRKAAREAERKGEVAPQPLFGEGEAARVRRALERDYLHVFAKATLNQEEAFRYVARYTSRGGFGNHQLESYDPETGAVVFRTKHGQTVRCSAEELVRRLLLHLLPHGFHRIRRYALLAPRGRTPRLAQARAAQGAPPLEAAEEDESGLSPTERFYLERGVDLNCCPRPGCGGRILRLQIGRRPVPLGQLHAKRRTSPPLVPP
jgi:hypothetical protein